MKTNKVKYNKKDFFVKYMNSSDNFKGILTFINGKNLIILNNELSIIEKQREFHRLIKNKKLRKGLI
ncbi:hypothetical protein [Clostridium chromiireducens]|uniref:Uncharacterized protein n=1 Tax=Clostridium chromiireducens TaxID=225345 RepID=A0A1V4IKA4_9CLOT|nr:hypothetical protein [Clostridium chromiireducens]OPJ60468.1 hypothetical protein CLCHR_29540 [Clostridium chromiireducens]